MINFSAAEFVRSAASVADFPQDDLPRCVFVGRSNVGKSSTINALTGRKNFARVSASPGKTVFVNLFLIDRRLWLVDLPGYGYSRAGKQERERYSRLIEQYFSAEMEKIRRIYLIVDARHKPTADDRLMMDWIRSYDLPATIIANKVDKLKKSELETQISFIKQAFLIPENAVLIPENADLMRENANLISEIADLIPFSAEKKTNRDRVLRDIEAAVSSPRTPPEGD